MELPIGALINPEAAVNSARILQQQISEEERRKGEVKPDPKMADTGPGVGKVVDLSA